MQFYVIAYAKGLVLIHFLVLARKSLPKLTPDRRGRRFAVANARAQSNRFSIHRPVADKVRGGLMK
jgi:hypothetical protein